MAKQKLDAKIPPVSAEEAHRMVRIVDEAIKRFEGSFDELESAIGMYFVGRQIGWKVLVLIHNKRTIKKYEDILGVEIRKEFQPEGPFIHKSPAYAVVKKLNAFWKAASGELPVENRRELQKS